MEQPKFSIIVPVYNVEQYLAQCIGSILQQDYENFELILVDDGSTDKSGKICDEYSIKDRRIKVVHKTNGGLSSARNAGIKKASGEYILFVDSDDYWASSILLSRIVDVEGKNLVVWKYQRGSDNNTISIDRSEWKTSIYFFKRDYTYLLKYGILFASACYMAIPSEWFANGALRFKEGDVSEDVEWFAELLSHIEQLIFIDAPIYVYRVRQGSLSNTVSEKQLSDLHGHITNLKAKFDESNDKVLRCYLAEQTANYIIVLSRSNADRNTINASRQLIPLLRYTVRRRSRIIFILATTFGLRFTIWILNIVDGIKNE